MAASWRYLQPGPHEKSVSRTVCSFTYCWFGEWDWEYLWCFCDIRSDVILCFSFHLVFPAPAQWKQHFVPVGLFRLQGKLGREYVHPALDRKQENMCVEGYWLFGDIPSQLYFSCLMPEWNMIGSLGDVSMGTQPFQTSLIGKQLSEYLPLPVLLGNS